MKVQLSAAPGLYLPEIGECIVYEVASSQHPQIGYCAGYEVWDEFLEKGQPRVGNSGARFHIKIANEPGGKVVNMRGIHGVCKASVFEEIYSKYKDFEGCDKKFIQKLIEDGVISRD